MSTVDPHERAPATPIAPRLTRISGRYARWPALALTCLLACAIGSGCAPAGPAASPLDAGPTDSAAADGAAGDVVDGGSSDGGSGDATPSDATSHDGLSSDALHADAHSVDAVDDAAGDAAAADAGAGKATAWGAITGACGAVAAELKVSAPSFLVSTLTFKDAAKFSPAGLSTGAKKRYEGENAGGSSICSEVMSMQVLHECEGAVLYKTEKEIIYTSTQGAITDYETTIAGHKVGVSVTRAYKGPVTNTYTGKDATALLKKKLAGVLESTAKVSPGDKWTKQILHIWTLRSDWVPVLKTAWQGIDAATKADTIVLVSIEIPPSGGKGWIVPDDCGAK